MAVTAIRLDLNGVGVDDVFLFLVTSGFVVVSGVSGIEVALGVVTITALVLAVIVVVIIVIHAPIEVVVGGVLFGYKQIERFKWRIRIQKKSDLRLTA